MRSDLDESLSLPLAPPLVADGEEAVSVSPELGGSGVNVINFFCLVTSKLEHLL